MEMKHGEITNKNLFEIDWERMHRQRMLRELHREPLQPGMRATWWNVCYQSKRRYRRFECSAMRSLHFAQQRGCLAWCQFWREHGELCMAMREQGWVPALKNQFLASMRSA